MSEAIAACTEAEFLAMDERSSVRHEFVGGRLYQTAGGNERQLRSPSLLSSDALTQVPGRPAVGRLLSAS